MYSLGHTAGKLKDSGDGVGNLEKVLTIKGKKVRVDLVEQTSTGFISILTKTYGKEMDPKVGVVILAHAVGEEDSLEPIEKEWVPNFLEKTLPYVPRVVLGIKTAEKKESKEGVEGEELAKRIGAKAAYVCSLENAEDVDKVMNEAVTTCSAVSTRSSGCVLT